MHQNVQTGSIWHHCSIRSTLKQGRSRNDSSIFNYVTGWATYGYGCHNQMWSSLLLHSLSIRLPLVLLCNTNKVHWKLDFSHNSCQCASEGNQAVACCPLENVLVFVTAYSNQQHGSWQPPTPTKLPFLLCASLGRRCWHVKRMTNLWLQNSPFKRHKGWIDKYKALQSGEKSRQKTKK